MIEIKGERELIQIDITECMTNKDKWQTGDSIKCNIYFQKLECKFVSKDVVISYDALKIFNNGLKQLLYHKGSDISLRGYLYSNKELLQQTIQEINSLL